MRIILDDSVSTVKRLRVSLGTLLAIEATADGNVTVGGIAPAGVIATEVRTAEAAIERAFEAIEQVNRLMHPRSEGSDLARINRAPLHAPTKVHASVGQLLNLAKRIHTLTEGVFDPCTPAQPGRLSDIEVLDDETEVVCHAPVALDFGGFAKGYAVDFAIEALVAGGCTAGLVNAGGDMRVFGQRDESVFVRGPAGELTAIELVNAALAVSDTMSGQRPPEHQGYYVRDTAATTAPDQHATYAAVIADKAVIADALAKCVLLCAPAVTTRALGAFGATQLRSTKAAQ
jgi:thiamine biosynthesis lipoprotein